MKTKLLIVDDELENLTAICGLLSDETYSVLRTTRPEKAFAIALESLPDLIITDWEMPGMSGIEFIRKLKSQEATRDIPVVMCTGRMTSSENLETALSAGAADYLRKPVEPIELQARLRSMLQLAASYRQIKEDQMELERRNSDLIRLNMELEIKTDELYRAATTDQLTQIHNRAYLMEALTREFANSRRHRIPLSCVLLDIDHFKSFNDDHGHQVGDFVLKATAQLIAGQTRKGDILARFGGEELVAILPDTDLEMGVLVAEKIRAAVEDAAYSRQDLQLKVTVSLGVADNLLGDPANEDEMLKHADDAVYVAKKQGRNRVVAFRPDPA